LKILGKPESLITFVKDRPGHDRRYAMDASRIMNDLHWRPACEFENGLEKTISWYVDNRVWWQRVLGGQYKEYYRVMYEER
jgi:dTDP-glucose 4,6-dehydratase